MTRSFADRFLSHLEAGGFFREGGRALVAVSGGADSMALLRLLADSRSELGVELVVGHVNHGTGPASDEAESAVSSFSHHLGLDCRVEHLGLGERWSETRARKERYAALGRIREENGCEYLVTAHHADDQAETVVLRLLKGSGTAGLAGIDAVRSSLVRPLLPFRRGEIEDYARESGLSERVVTDPGNADLRHDRNWVRAEMLPAIEARYGEEGIEGILRTAEHAAEDRLAWAQLLRFEELGLEVADGWAEVARAPLQRYDKALSEALLRGFARELGVVLGRKQAALVRRFVVSGTSGHSLDVGGGWRAELVFDRLRLTGPEASEPATEGERQWGTAVGSLIWEGWLISWRPGEADEIRRSSNTTWVTPGEGIVRGLARGDRMAPLGGKGSRPLRRLMMEARVSSRERWNYPVFERNGTIIWVPGVCRSAADLPGTGDEAIRIDAIRA